MSEEEAIELLQELRLDGYDCRIKKPMLDPEYYIIVDGKL